MDFSLSFFLFSFSHQLLVQKERQLFLFLVLKGHLQVRTLLLLQVELLLWDSNDILPIVWDEAPLSIKYYTSGDFQSIDLLNTDVLSDLSYSVLSVGNTWSPFPRARAAIRQSLADVTSATMCEVYVCISTLREVRINIEIQSILLP